MSPFLTVTTAIAMVGLLVLGATRAIQMRVWKPFLVEALGVTAFAVFLNWLFGFPIPVSAAVAKGPQEDFTTASVLFVCMILGMLAQAFYQYFSLSLPKRVRKKFDWASFLAPMFASPIVFIPLMVAMQNANVDLKALTVPRMMIFFVAFQNGFFWKEHFDRRRHEDEARGI